jgi:hypothetical protein
LHKQYVEHFPLAVSWQCGLTSTYGDVGDYAECKRLFEERASTGFVGIPMTHDWLSCHLLLANACRYSRDAERAPILRERLLPFEGNIWIMGLGNFICGAVAQFVGELHILVRDFPAAERSYERSLDIARRLRAPGLVAFSKVGLAGMLAARRTGNDIVCAKGLIAEARPDIVSVGFAFLGRRADEIERML